MPPFIGRKRSPPPARIATQPPTKRAKTAGDAIDEFSRPALKSTKTFSLGTDSSSSSLSDVDSDDFEDVATSKPKKSSSRKPTASARGKQSGPKPKVNPKAQSESDQDATEEDHDSDDFEDVDHTGLADTADFSERTFADVKLSVKKDEPVDFEAIRRAAKGKKGPSRREKHARVITHQMHVQFLLWHNALRNSWICDSKVQETLVKQLPNQITREVERCKRASGLVKQEEETSPKGKKQKKKKLLSGRTHRDWGNPTKPLDGQKPDLSRGDPLISLLKILASYWKKRFAITAPGLRKRGYGTKAGLRADIDSYRHDKHHPAKHGERIKDIQAFREIAESCRGSRDVGAQLFTALLRGLGIEARLVASLQPAGYGWTKAEQMVPRKIVLSDDEVQPSSSEDDDASVKQIKPSKAKKNKTVKSGSSRASKKGGGAKDLPIDLDSDVSDPPSSDNDSIVDITPSMPKATKPKYDRDLPYPTYWTEAISSVTHKVYPVSPLVLDQPLVATMPEHLQAFEPRGLKAEKAKQIMAYVVAHQQDGTAKDVTVRYLRKQLWPGKTRGVRLPAEKVTIWDRRGKSKRYDNYDWFEDVMKWYIRLPQKRTESDKLEDQTDLKIAKPEIKDADAEDTLQSLKSSKEFVLERHLKREEALKPGAEPDRMFNPDKKGANNNEEPVYRRSDVLRCLTAESWHKEGRAPLPGSLPLKMVPVRAVTLARKRDAEEHLARTGEKQMQGLYSLDQTDWIIPPPIGPDRKIPKNSYGNMDCFVPSMVPKGAVHLPYKGTMRICKKLEIDFSEAVVGFEFGNKMAVPVIKGVVVAEENEDVVMEAWREWQREQEIKEAVKQEKLILEMWRKFVLGLRIRERVIDDYGEGADDMAMTRGETRDDAIAVEDEEMPEAGGFLPEGVDVPETEDIGGGFLLDHEDDAEHMEDLVLEERGGEDEQDETSLDAVQMYPTPRSDLSPNKTSDKKSKSKSRASTKSVIVDHKSSELSDNKEPHLSDTSQDIHPAQPATANKSSKTNKSTTPNPTKSSGKRTSTSTSPSNTLSQKPRSKTRTQTPFPNPSSHRTSARRSTTNKRLQSYKEETSDSNDDPEHDVTTTVKAEIDTDADTDADADSNIDDNADTNPNHTTPPSVSTKSAKRGRGRGRGRPRNPNNNAPASTASMKRGGPRQKEKEREREKKPRLVKRESTLVTSPYFEASQSS